MITIPDAFRWLNWENPSHLSQSNQFSIWQIEDTKVSEAERNALFDSLLHCVHEFTDPLEKAEVYIYLAVSRFNRNNRDEARRLLFEALPIYKEHKERHREATTHWMLFIVQRLLLENIQAHSHGREARTQFGEQAVSYAQTGDAARSRWYRDRITEMNVDLALIPEEAYEWILQFSTSKLSEPAKSVREKIRQLIKNKCFEEAYTQINYLKSLTHSYADPTGSAEALAFCGLSMNQMGNRAEAIHLLRQAMAETVHSSHKYTAIRWMLGLIQSRQQADRVAGVNNLEACIKSFASLSEQADQKARRDEIAWYGPQIIAMKTALEIQVQQPC